MLTHKRVPGPCCTMSESILTLQVSIRIGSSRAKVALPKTTPEMSPLVLVVGTSDR